MFDITTGLKRHLVEKHGLAADANDADARKLLAKLYADGKISDDEIKKHLPQEPAEDRLKMLGSQIAQGVLAGLSQHQQGGGTAVEDPPEDQGDDEKDVQALIDKALGEYEKDFESRLMQKLQGQARGGDGASVDGYKALAGWAKDQEPDDPVAIRVKSRVERWDDTKTAAQRPDKWAKHFGGKPIEHNGRELNKTTPRRLAMIAAWTKFTGVPEALTEGDRDVVQWILHREKFYADPHSTEPRLLTEDERHKLWAYHTSPHRKALIDDNTSGGENAVPEFFDTDLILLPVLGGEVSPLVNMVDVPRGSSADNFTMGNVTFAAANTEGSAVSLFSTTSFIAAHDTTFFRAAGAIEVGRNFLLDATPGLGQQIQNSYQRKAAEWLDEQIVVGDGTNEPQGIFNASGTTDITAGTPTTGPLTITDTMNLLFGVSKAFRQNYPSRQAAWVMTDNSYKRLRSIATGVTGDTRLIFGMEVESYMLHGHPVAIVETGLGENQIAFCQFGGYRLYRRQGLRLFREDRGATLTLENTIILGADMRYGGQLDRGGYAAVMDSAPSS